MKRKVLDLFRIYRFYRKFKYWFDRLFKTLSQQEREILNYQFFREVLWEDNPESYATIGKLHRISTVQARQITIRAHEKLRSAIQNKFNLFAWEEFEPDIKKIFPSVFSEDLAQTPISIIPLSSRTQLALSRARIKTFGDLRGWSFSDYSSFTGKELISIRNFGKKSLAELKHKVSEYLLSVWSKQPKKEGGK